MGDDGAASGVTNVRVAVRCRPFNGKERANGETSCVRIASSHDQLVLVNPTGSGEEHSFAFDLVIDESFSQEQVWQNVGVPILDKAFGGYNGTIFAYGQTGSGKTWSMQGAPDNEELQGIIPRMNRNLFDRIEKDKNRRPTVQFLVTVSYFEIYNEIIFDLLDASDRSKRRKNNQAGNSQAGLEIKEHPVLGVYVKGLNEIVVDNAVKLQEIIDQGMGNRTVASTQMNADSSRSHSVFIITVHQKDLEDESKNIFAKVNLVDLAGSERVKSTGATGSTLKEGANINKSLSALGNVINALVESSKGKGNTFIPYRNSKLTRVLQESLGGNSITAMLAALSPAACNFEETLSTLKYANRAKAIKVNAVKNEEASQISRLNEEIKMLRLKLEGQATNQVNSSVDLLPASQELEEKHRQQLRELEEAMKNTWEEKAKISEEYERDRQQLLVDQQVAARQLEAARERNWALLEQKGDLEISLSHVKDLVKNSSEGEATARAPGIQEKRNAELLSLLPLADLTKVLKEIILHERDLTEQDTIVQVYRSSLDKDSSALIKQTNQTASGGANFSGVDSNLLSMLRQLKDKFSATNAEVVRWTTIQDNLLLKLKQFLNCMSESAIVQQLMVQSQSENLDIREIAKGFAMLSRQAAQRLSKDREAVDRTRFQLIDFQAMNGDLKTLLSIYDKSLSSSLAVIGGDGSSGGLLEQITSTQTSVQNSKKSLVSLTEEFTKMWKIHDGANSGIAPTRASSPTSGTPPLLHSSSPQQRSTAQDEESVEGLVAENYKPPETKKGSSKSENGDVRINSRYGWTRTSSDADGATLTLCLPIVRDVSAVQVQSGMFRALQSTVVAAQPPVNSVPPASTAIVPVPLPCGLTMASCCGSTEQTALALADVLDWSTLLKKNPPEKFLKRPPVRFLFDLVKYVGEIVMTMTAGKSKFLPESLLQADWEVVSATKQSKIDFMQELINFISSSVGAPPATTAHSIVTGSDAELTNMMLQQLAIALFSFKHTLAVSANSAPQKTVKTVIETKVWVKTVRIMLSTDGQVWTHDEKYDTNIAVSSDEVKVVRLRSDGSSIAARFVRVVPLTWSTADGISFGSSAPAKVGPAIRVGVLAATLAKYIAPSANHLTLESGNSEGSALKVEATKVLHVLTVLCDALNSLIGTVEIISHIDDLQKIKKQQEVNKNLEILAQEKLALEKLLESEKQTLANDKQDLADQLKKCFNQLRETKSMFEREQEINNQLEKSRKQLESEKTIFQNSVKELEKENATLKSEVLKLQANREKDRHFIEKVEAKLNSREKDAEAMRSELDLFQQRKVAWDNDREELNSQIVILTEERDASRASEEDLFGRLNERTNDLERLQESYVDIGDRCNDLQDEVAELREQVAALQEALATRAKFAMSASSTPAVTLPAPAPAPAAAASSTKPPPVKPVQDKDKDKGGSAKGASAALAKQPATSFSAAAYKDDFEEYEDEFEDDN